MSEFHPIIKLPPDYEVFDFSKGYHPEQMRDRYLIGRYNEDRSGLYTGDQFNSGGVENARTIHVGIDIGGPVGTAVYAFDDGEIFMTAINGTPGDYGGTLITTHTFQGRTLYALYGHLSHRSVELWASDKVKSHTFKKGDTLGWIGSETENGGWNPHVHIQLSWVRPDKCDLPGVVSLKDREQALRDYPDPRLVLGPIYIDRALA
jgi:hypothetical protein